MPCLGLGSAWQSHHGEGNQACLWEPEGNFLTQGLHKSRRTQERGDFCVSMGSYFCVEGVWARKAKHSFKNYPKGERLVQTQSREEVPGHWEARLSFLSVLKAFGMASAHLKGSSQAGEEMPTEEKPLLATLVLGESPCTLSHSRP